MRRLAVVVVALSFTGTAAASHGEPPWTGGASVVTAFEAKAGEVATQIAGRQSGVVCNSESDWNALGSSRGFDPAGILGFVTFIGSQPLTDTQLSPSTCQYVDEFWAKPSGEKPTLCPVATTVYETVTRKVRTPVKKRVKVKVRGKVKIVVKTKFVTRSFKEEVAREVEVATPCYAGDERSAAEMPESYWDDYYLYVRSLHTLTHESFHLKGIQDEAVTDCYALQTIASVAEQLGASAEDARAIALYDWDYIYPTRRESQPEYWSPECRDGGTLDLDPSSTAWPTA